jgi:hypothetical protein
VALLLLSACGGSKISQTVRPAPLSHPLRSIALAPSGGLLADAIGVELANRGYVVIDTQQTSALLIRVNASELELLSPRSLTGFREQGIDAILAVKAAFARDDRPQSASVRLNSTYTSQVLAGVSWQNGWGGRSGSIADRVMRQDTADAAREIVDGLVKGLRP